MGERRLGRRWYWEYWGFPCLRGRQTPTAEGEKCRVAPLDLLAGVIAPWAAAFRGLDTLTVDKACARVAGVHMPAPEMSANSQDHIKLGRSTPFETASLTAARSNVRISCSTFRKPSFRNRPLRSSPPYPFLLAHSLFYPARWNRIPPLLPPLPVRRAAGAGTARRRRVAVAWQARGTRFNLTCPVIQQARSRCVARASWVRRRRKRPRNPVYTVNFVGESHCRVAEARFAALPGRRLSG